LEGGIAIVDMRPPEAYKAGHIKGAVSIWRTDIERHDLAYGGMAIEKENLERLLGSKGISDANRVVVYDDKGCVDAARLWWILKLYGHEKVSLLDGGLHAWKEILDTVATERHPVEFSFSELKEKHLNLDFEAFENLRKTENVKLIDGRSYEEFDGQLMKDGAFLSGHIPGALNQCYSGSIDFSEGGEMKLKPESDLRIIYEKLAMPDDTVIVYCHSGVRSAHTYMVLTEILGYQNVYNYDGSWIEWSFKQTHPSEEFFTR
ncbi:MAG TPA: sulfurtransferase, partial [Cryomorphaceae bacterium]|nr:sulfurtransferase [Cryomorphaceae bacterium]